MDAELTALATSGATVLVQQMVGDGWAQVRDRLAALFSRGGDSEGPSGDGARGELDRFRGELVAARETGDEEATADVEAGVRARLRGALRADPALAGELRALLDELYPPEAPGAPGSVHNVINDGVFHHAVIQAGSVGAVHQHVERRRPPSDGADVDA